MDHLYEGVGRHVSLKLVSQDEAGVVVHHGDQVVVATTYDPEVGGIGGPYLVGARGLAMVLLARGQPCLRPLHQTLPAQDTVDGRFLYGEALLVGDPRGHLMAAQLWHLPGC